MGQLSTSVDKNGVHGAKTRELDVHKTSGAIVNSWRQRWALTANAALCCAKSDVRIDWRSLAARGITRPPRMHLGPQQATQEREGYQTAAGKHNAAVDEIERANEAVARVNRQIKILLARRRRARVQHQIKQGRRRALWRNPATPPAVIPHAAATNQQAASSPISQPESATPTPKKPARRR